MWITDRVDEELGAALAEVRRFAQRRVAPLAARHEQPMGADALSRLLTEADELGLSSETDGLWVDKGDGVVASVALLATVAEHSAGVAFALHQRALARRVVASAGIDGAVDLVAAHGHYGIGRGALADWLAGEPDADELLVDVYGVARPRVLTAAALPDTVLLPVWRDGLELHVIPRPAVVPFSHAHGLDELVTFQLSIQGNAKVRVTGVRARAAFLLALRAEALASVVIAAAAVRRGTKLARQFAEQRRQGGAVIADHPAVSQLLALPSSVLSGVSAEILAQAAQPATEHSVVAALSLSAGAHPRLADAANAALQVFGGLGYMRDTGLEKIVRDENHLRRYLASPAELSAVAARWERIHG